MRKSLFKFMRVATAVAAAVVYASGCFSGYAADLVQKNVFAYDITVEDGDNAFNKTVKYKLNGLTSKVVIEVLNGSTVLASYNGTTDQSNEVNIDLRAIGASNLTSATLKYQVKATTQTTVAKDAPHYIADKTKGHGSDNNGRYRFLNPWSITVNNAPSSPTFGRILVTESKYDEAIGINSTAGTSTTNYHSKVNASGNSGRGAAIYAFDPQWQPIANNTAGTKFGFVGKLDITKAKLNVKYSAYSVTVSGTTYTGADKVVNTFSCVRYSAGGGLYFSSANGNYAPVYKFSSATNLDGDTKTLFKTGSGTSHGVTKVHAFDITGSGDNFKILVLHNEIGCPQPSNKAFNTSLYNVGTNTDYNTGANINRSCTANNTKNDMLQKVALDPTGASFWISRNAGTDVINYRHQVQSTSTPSQFNSSPDKYLYNGTTNDYSRVGAVAYNKDGTLMACQSKKGKITVYKCTDPTDYSKLTEYCNIVIGTSAGETGNLLSGQYADINDIAFDYANNVYATCVTGGVTFSFQIKNPDGATVTTPVRSAYTITDYNGISSIANNTAAYNRYSKVATVNWSGITNLPDATGYRIYRGSTLVGTVAANVRSFTEEVADEGTYAYTVKAVNKFGREIVASPASSITVGNFPEVNLGVNYETKGVVELQWTGKNTSDVATFKIYRDGDEYQTLAGTAKEFTITDPKTEDAHFYTIAGYTAGGDCVQSNTVMIGFINPGLTIQPEYGETRYSDHGIKRLSASVEWKRPLSHEFTDVATSSRYVLSHYELLFMGPDDESIDITDADVTYTIGEETFNATVTDHNDDDIMEVDDPITAHLLAAGPMNVRSRAGDELTDEVGIDQDVTFTASYPGNDIVFGEYKIQVTPVYINAANDDETLTYGAVARNSAEQNTDIFEPVTDLSVKVYKQEDPLLYRADINFYAPATKEPVTYYEIFTRKIGTTEWQKLDNFFAIMGDDLQFYSSALNSNPSLKAPAARSSEEESDDDDKVDFEIGMQDGVIVGTYDLSVSSPDRGYATSPIEDGQTKCVAFFYSQTDPRDSEYMVTAYYGASNMYLLDASETDVSCDPVTPQNDLIITLVEGITADNSAEKLFAYPVPATNVITVEATNPFHGVKIYSTSGILVKTADSPAGTNMMKINVSDLVPGLYMLVSDNGNHTTIVKK